MFDYQAGEKYKLTLIMVGVAGLLAGMFFTMLLMPSEAPASKRRAPLTRASTDPDVTGGGKFSSSPIAAAMLRDNGAQQGAPGSPNSVSAPAMNPATYVDRAQVPNFMSAFLSRVWDLGAETAQGSQEAAMSVMTANCAAAYRNNIWTPTLAHQVQQSGLKSTFTPSTVEPSENLQDGSVVVKVKGVQILSAASGQQKQRIINVEYMVVQTPEGLKISGISEGTGG